ncbi:MAG: tetratricopeptide repeat protein, partial [Deltaproteobacteria bacterium]
MPLDLEFQRRAFGENLPEVPQLRDPRCGDNGGPRVELEVRKFLASAENRPEQALAAASRALDLDPLSPWVNVNLAIVQFSLGLWDDAGDAVSRAIEIDPTDPSAFNARARLYIWRDDCKRALSDANDNIRLSSGKGGYTRRAAIYIAMGRFLEAKADVVAAEKLTPPASPDYAQLLDTWADVHVGLGDYDSAVNDLTRAIEQRPLLYWLVEHRGVVQFH